MNHAILTSTTDVALQTTDGVTYIPALFAQPGEKAVYHFVEFFKATIRNPNTRTAYAHAVTRFAQWCEGHGLTIYQLNPAILGEYLDYLRADHALKLSDPSIKLHLSAIRRLFDHLVMKQVIQFNPTNSVRGPKHIVEKGKTPVLSKEDVRLLLDSVPTTNISGLRDRALIGVMLYEWVRVESAVNMNVEDYFAMSSKEWWCRFKLKGGKQHLLPAHHQAQLFLDEYLAAAGIADDLKSPLFRSLTPSRQLSQNRLQTKHAWKMVKRRTKRAGLPLHITTHSFRATAITEFRRGGGTLEKAQRIAAHADARTTKLYDHSEAEITRSEIEGVQF